jgi:hypothetical protein
MRNPKNPNNPVNTETTENNAITRTPIIQLFTYHWTSLQILHSEFFLI